MIQIHHEYPDIVTLILSPGMGKLIVSFVFRQSNSCLPVSSDMGKEATAAAGIDIETFPGIITPAVSGQHVVDFVAATEKGSPLAGVLVDTSKGAPYTVYPW